MLNSSVCQPMILRSFKPLVFCGIGFFSFFCFSSFFSFFFCLVGIVGKLVCVGGLLFVCFWGFFSLDHYVSHVIHYTDLNNEVSTILKTRIW